MSIRIDDGFKTLISFALSSSVKFWEKSITPPGMSGGGPNDTTTMRNTLYRTKAPKKLITLDPATVVVAYDPAVYPQIVSMLNQNQAITITFPDDSTLVFWGWIDSFAPSEASEGEQPTATVTIQPSNQNASGVETAPVQTDPSA